MLLAGNPDDITQALQRVLEQGASVDALSSVLARAGIHLVARFHVQNEEDWDDVLHVISYANAIDVLARRAVGRSLEGNVALMNAVTHGAMFVYLSYSCATCFSFFDADDAEAAARRVVEREGVGKRGTWGAGVVAGISCRCTVFSLSAS